MSGYYWMISTQIWLAALAVTFDARVFAAGNVIFCGVMAWRRTRS